MIPWRWALSGAAALFVLIVVAAGGASISVAPAGAICEASSETSGGSVDGVPSRYIAFYKGAAERFELGRRGPAILAAIHKVETDFGRLDAPGVNHGANSAGAKGPMQFLGGTWDAYGVDGDRDGTKDVYNSHDAIYGAANYLSASGAPGEWYRAIFAYNHADWYVAKVEGFAEQFGGFESVTVAETTCEAPAEGEADLSQAVRVSSPRTYKTLPAKLMAAGRAPQAIDARIYDNAVWALRHYEMRVTAARESGHASHGDGGALDLVPAGDLGSQDVWDDSTGAFARDLGWRPSCASSGVAPTCALVGAIRFVGYDGYRSHGSPKTCGGGCPAHLHVSWQSATGGVAALLPAPAWAMVFVSPAAAGGSV
jgi:hypothetical protein